MNSLVEVITARDLLVNLTLRELRSKYKRSLLGWSWSLVNPLASVLIFTIVFRYFLRISPPVGDPSGLQNFALFLLCGLLPWNFFGNSILGSIVILVGNAGLVKKVYFPRSLLVFANTGSWAISLLIEICVLAIALLVAGNFILPWLPLLLVLIVLMSVFYTGLSLALSAANVYFRDVQHFVAVLLQLWFYATPVVYPVDMVPLRAEIAGRSVPLRFLYELNPVASFIHAVRDCVYDLRFPDVKLLAYLITISLVTFAAGFALFSRLEPRMAEEL